jgi:uncharacterized membrane protein YozB (DUF420 family)
VMSARSELKWTSDRTPRRQGFQTGVRRVLYLPLLYCHELIAYVGGIVGLSTTLPASASAKKKKETHTQREGERVVSVCSMPALLSIEHLGNIVFFPLSIWPTLFSFPYMT